MEKQFQTGALISGILVAVGLISTPASANAVGGSMDFTIVGIPPGVNEHVDITFTYDSTTGVINPGTITGTQDGTPVTGPLAPGTLHNNDNIFFNHGHFIDGQGVAYTETGTPPPEQYAVWWNDALNTYQGMWNGSPPMTFEVIDFRATSAPGPTVAAGLPGVLLMLVGGLMWWRRKLTFSLMP